MTDHEHALDMVQNRLDGKPVSTSIKLPYGSAKAILHGIEKRHYVTDETEDTEDDERVVREPVKQDQKLRNRPIINWGAHWNSGRQNPCTHCHQPALLLDDAGRPAHKVCAETALAQLLR